MLLGLTRATILFALFEVIILTRINNKICGIVILIIIIKMETSLSLCV